MQHGQCQFKFRDDSTDTEPGAFSGLASAFGNVDDGMDIVAKGAFKASLREAMPKLFLHHGFSDLGNTPIGKIDSAKETDDGLDIKGRVFLETDILRLAHRGMKEGVFDGLSIGYKPVKWSMDSKTGVRTLKEVLLREVSLVTFPMNRSTTIESVKSRIAAGDDISKRELEEVLRDAGLSRKQAATLIAGGYAGLSLRDADDAGDMTEILNSLRSKLK
jgi:HK97 family phage prohead protease